MRKFILSETNQRFVVIQKETETFHKEMSPSFY